MDGGQHPSPPAMHTPFINELVIPGGVGGDPVGPVREHLGGATEVIIEPKRLFRPMTDAITRDTATLPARFDRESYCGDRHFDYWLSGLDHALTIREMCENAGVAVTPSSRVFDLGCSTCRVLRHFHFQFDVARVHGADVNKRNVWWVQKHLPRAFEVFHNHALPHLPIEDRTLDIVFAISVFTHIDHLEQAWLLELRRVLRPGGVLVLSAHTERTWTAMGPEFKMYGNLLKRSAEVLEGPVTPETFQSPMPRERVTFTVPGRLASNCQVFHSTEYIRRVWARFMDVVEIRPAAFVNHDAVVMRKA